MHGEMEARHAANRIREARDRVVGGRHRAVPALVRHGEVERLKELLARLHRAHDLPAILDQRVATVRIDAPLGVDEIAMVGDQPRDAVVATAAFLAGSECENERSLGHDVLALETQQRFGDRRRAALDVARAAAVEESVALRELVRIDRPVGAKRLDDIEVCDEENRLQCLRRPLHAHDDIRILVAGRAEHVDVAGGESGVEEALGDRVRGWRGAPLLVRRLNLDQLLKNRARLGLVGGERGLRPRGDWSEEGECEEERRAGHRHGRWRTGLGGITNLAARTVLRQGARRSQTRARQLRSKGSVDAWERRS